MRSTGNIVHWQEVVLKTSIYRQNDLTTLKECRLTVEGNEIIWGVTAICEVKDLFYDSLGKVFTRTTKFPLTVLCGDFNWGPINWSDVCLEEELRHNTRELSLAS